MSDDLSDNGVVLGGDTSDEDAKKVEVPKREPPQEENFSLEREEEIRNQLARVKAARNAAVRQAHAAAQVLKHHNIKVDLKELDVSGIMIDKQGLPSGEIPYKPSDARKNTSSSHTSSRSGSQITIEMVKKMTPDQINKNWDQIKEVLRSQYAK